ncbi:MAG: DUF6116 family protein [Acidobacteriota bacterium]
MAHSPSDTRRKSFIENFAGRLKYPQLFFVTAAVFLIDLVLPDMIPFADEIMLGLLTVFLGRLRRPEAAQDDDHDDGFHRRRPKNVTPPGTDRR